MAQVFIALGSNLNDPLKQANHAIEALNQLQQTRVVAVSPFYRSKPLGPQNQQDYLNAVIELTTTLLPHPLLDHLQQIETSQGRVRKNERWGARTLDLDILLYDNLSIVSERLTLPHYDMKRREFVLYPLYDIAPDLVLPDNTPLIDLIKITPLNDMVHWSKNNQN